MERALQLSLYGGPRVSPNPFVGAVIVAGGRIIGEGFHREFGGPHAEVNAIKAVREEDLPLLASSTMYVTLEPCSHFGKTPPCASLIIRTGIPRVIIAAEDPFLKDHESGIAMMERAGIEVKTGLLRQEARNINRRFFTSHEHKRPYVLLKWAQSADGCIADRGGKPVNLSSPFTRMLMHRERAMYDAILVGTDTILNDRPRLDCRLWPTRDCSRRPLKVTFDSPRLTGDFGSYREWALKARGESLSTFLRRLYADHKVTSLMVEGGAKTLSEFLEQGLFDEIRVETSPVVLGEGIGGPDFSEALRKGGFKSLVPEVFGGNTLCRFVKNY